MSNRTVAAALSVAESTLRNWRRERPDFDRATRDAVEACRQRLAEREHDQAWQRVAWSVTRGLEGMADADARARGIISG